MIVHRFALDFTLNEGWLRPWIDGLREGRAVGCQCKACRKTSFPPERCCACGHTEADWTVLSGRARIIHRADGLDGSFGLVQFEGADNATTVRLSDVPVQADHGWLQPCPDGLPALVIGPRKPGTRQ